jgi:predicted nucleic acid-binding protein
VFPLLITNLIIVLNELLQYCIIANTETTRDWWEYRRSTFTLYISQVVLDEVMLGDAEMAAKRLEVLQGFPLLELSDAVQDLAAQFLSRSNLPPKAAADAVHIATATVHGMDYLLSCFAFKLGFLSAGLLAVSRSPDQFKCRTA